MRNFPDFLSAYQKYAHDDFCPPQFHLWTGLSLIAGALERKVWVRPFKKPQYPNLYILLVSHPQAGKSTALDIGSNIIEEFKKQHNPKFKIIPEQATEAALIDIMRILESLELSKTRGIQFSSGYFYASEASSSALKNEHGDFNATLTRLYDCPSVFRKKLKGESFTTDIPNISFNVLAATTFDFLKKLVNEESVHGGLASRFVYVVSKKRFIRNPKWGENTEKDEKMEQLLINDLAHINTLKGQFETTPGFRDMWEKAHPEFDRYLIDLDSSRVESIMARKLTNLLKVAMLLSISESDSLILNESHWERAEKFMEAVMVDNPFILSSAIIAKTETQAGLNQLILQSLKTKGGSVKMTEIRKMVLKHGNDISKFQSTIEFLKNSGQLELTIVGGFDHVKLLVDPNTNL